MNLESEFRTVFVRDIALPGRAGIAIGPFGSKLRAELYRPAGVRVIRGQDISDGQFLDDASMPCVSEETAQGLSGCLVRAGDLVFPHRGAIGRVGIVSNDRYLLSSSMMKLTCNLEVACPLYVFYYFRGPGKKELLDRSSTVGTPGIGQPLKSLREIPVSLPSLGTQESIAGVLGALDDKIAANTNLIASLEELSGFLYSSRLHSSTTRPLTEIATFVNGKAFTKNASGSGRVVIRIAELNSGLGASTVYSDAEVGDDHTARPGDLLFAWSGSLTVHRWFRPDGIVNQHIFKVIPNENYPMWLVHQILRCKLGYFRDVAANKATTMGHIQRRHIEEPVEVPDDTQISEMDSLMGGLWDRALATEIESQSLAQTRDNLLPLLMSGNLRVRDAEKQLEEVL